MKKSFIVFALALTAIVSANVPTHAGPGAPAGNPQMQLFELPGGATFSTGYNVNDVLTYNPKGRYGWTLNAKYTPLNSFDNTTTLTGVSMMTVAPDGKTFVLANERTLQLREMTRGAQRFSVPSGGDDSQNVQLTDYAISPDSTRLAVAEIVKATSVQPGVDVQTPRLRVFDVRSGAQLQDLALPHYADNLEWTANTRVEIRWTNPIVFEKDRAFIPEAERELSQSFDVALAPTTFVPAKLSLAGAQPDAPPKTARKKTSTRRRLARRSPKTSRTRQRR